MSLYSNIFDAHAHYDDKWFDDDRFELLENIHTKGVCGIVNNAVDLETAKNCIEYAEKYDLDIIFGIEEQIYDGLEILCYGITPEFLYNNPQLLYNSLEEWHKTAQSYGALIIQAHPFRDRFYINNPRVFPIEFIDGIEIYNYGNSAENNIMAENFYSKHNDLIITGGADAHDDSILCVSGIETCTRIRNETELVSVLKSGNYAIIK